MSLTPSEKEIAHAREQGQLLWAYSFQRDSTKEYHQAMELAACMAADECFSDTGWTLEARNATDFYQPMGPLGDEEPEVALATYIFKRK